MCQSPKLRFSLTSGRVAAISLVLIFCFAECAAASCNSYGHSCWGAHGKRSGNNLNLESNLVRQRGDILDRKWIFSRILPASVESRPWKLRNDDTVDKGRQIVDNQVVNRNEDQEEQDVAEVQDVLPPSEDILYLDDFATRSLSPESKLHLIKLLKSSARLN